MIPSGFFQISLLKLFQKFLQAILKYSSSNYSSNFQEFCRDSFRILPGFPSLIFLEISTLIFRNSFRDTFQDSFGDYFKTLSLFFPLIPVEISPGTAMLLFSSEIHIGIPFGDFPYIVSGNSSDISIGIPSLISHTICSEISPEFFVKGSFNSIKDSYLDSLRKFSLIFFQRFLLGLLYGFLLTFSTGFLSGLSWKF